MSISKADAMVVHAIGVIHSEHHVPEQTPIQPEFAAGCEGWVEIFPAYADGLKDIETFTHLILLYAFHAAGEPELIVRPFLDDTPRGVFATRHPRRPNRIGLSVVRLMRREGAVLHIADVDILDSTPLIDIKPYVPRFDAPQGAGGGWTEAIDPEQARKRGRRGCRYGEAKE
jgi:tRNA (adenine37-N6)-methyltransferase